MVCCIKMGSRKTLSAKGLLGTIHNAFMGIKEPRKRVSRTKLIRVVDCLMSGLAVFGLKYPSLFKFDENHQEDIHIRHNLRTLYNIEKAPSDTYMRERLDEVDPVSLRKAFKAVFATVQRGKELEAYRYLADHYLVAGDGTGFFKSNCISCRNCCVKYEHKLRIKISNKKPADASKIKARSYLLFKPDVLSWKLIHFNADSEETVISLADINGLLGLLEGKKKPKDLSEADKQLIEERIEAYHRVKFPEEEATYYHHLYCAAIVHPDKKMVIPFAPEPIMNVDGSTKNDCERNASKRLYQDLRREHPHLKVIIVEDALASNYPHLNELKNNNMRYIIGVKPGDHQFLFKWVDEQACQVYQHQTEDGITHAYRYINDAPLNKSHSDFKVNFLEYWETDKKGVTQHFCWVTDIAITNDNVYDIMRGGRVNWKVENGLFNTLKNQNYHFEHNFGHGEKNLCTVFVMLMMLAFFVDQVQELSCHIFQQARARYRSRTTLWDKIKSYFLGYFIDSWDDLFNAIIHARVAQLPLDST